MSHVHDPDAFDLNDHHDLATDLQWRRQPLALKPIAPGDVLRVIDETSAAANHVTMLLASVRSEADWSGWPSVLGSTGVTARALRGS